MDELQARDGLVGAWRLVSWENRAADGQVTYPMGSDALGCLLYTADGHGNRLEFLEPIGSPDSLAGD